MFTAADFCSIQIFFAIAQRERFLKLFPEDGPQMIRCQNVYPYHKNLKFSPENNAQKKSIHLHAKDAIMANPDSVQNCKISLTLQIDIDEIIKMKKLHHSQKI